MLESLPCRAWCNSSSHPSGARAPDMCGSRAFEEALPLQELDTQQQQHAGLRQRHEQLQRALQEHEQACPTTKGLTGKLCLACS